MTLLGAVGAGLLLGLSSGAGCFWSCASVMAPYLVCTGGAVEGPRWSSVPGALRALLWYNLGRLVAYLGAGVLLALLARGGALLPPVVSPLTQFATAALLVWTLLTARNSQGCPAPRTRRHRGALTLGLLQGITPCPPFIAAVGLALSAESPAAGPLLFAALFAGTALYTLPLALLEPLQRSRPLALATHLVGWAVAAYLVANAATTLAKLS